MIGITGGAGSGKTALAKIFASFGARVIDADRLGHRLLWRSSPCYGMLVRKFGQGILDRRGSINRKKLGAIVFTDKRKLKILNGIVHPLLKRMILERIKRFRSGRRPIVVDAALLAFWGMEGQVDELIVVTAPESLRIKRLLSKGADLQKAKDIIKTQHEQDRADISPDWVIENGGSKAHLSQKARSVWQRILRKHNIESTRRIG